MTQKDAITKLLNVAKNELGYHEKASNSQLDSKTANSGSGNWTKFARDLDALGNFYNGPKNGYAWCDVFVDYCFVTAFGANIGREMLCQPLNSAGAGCMYSAQYYKQAGRWVTYPQEGDQIFFSYSRGEYSHTGIVEAVSNGMVHTIEGNSSDQVARRSYPIASGSIAGYGRPNWDLASGVSESAVPQSTVTPAPAATHTVDTDMVLRRGMAGVEVQAYQQKLIELGFNLGKYGADGDFGRETRDAVKAFQEKYKLNPVDGEIGRDTKAAINKAYAALKKGNTSVNTDTQQVVYGTPVPNTPSTGEKTFSAIGDIINFTGSKQYSTASGVNASRCKSGRALIIGLNKNGKYPYQLCKINGYGSTVYGWVAYEDVVKVT